MNNLFERRKYFNRHLPKLIGADRLKAIKGLGNTCPSCGYPTIYARCSFDICSICFWEDDGQDDQEADEVFGGPNDDYSLTEHRLEWAKKLKELKMDNSEGARLLNRIDKLIASDQKTDIPEVLELVKKLSSWFDKQRAFRCN